MLNPNRTTKEKFITDLNTTCNDYETQTLTLRWNITNAQPKRKKDLEKIKQLIAQYANEECSILELKNNLISFINNLKTGPNIYLPLTNIGARVPISSSSVLKNKITEVLNQYEDTQLLSPSTKSSEDSKNSKIKSPDNLRSVPIKSPKTPPIEDISQDNHHATSNKHPIVNLQKQYRNNQRMLHI